MYNNKLFKILQQKEMSDQYVPDDQRDAVLDKLLQIPENKVNFNQSIIQITGLL